MKRNDPQAEVKELGKHEFDTAQYKSEYSFLNADLSTHVKATATLAAAMRIGATIPAGSIFQIQSIKNVSVPKRNQEDRTVAYDRKTHLLKLAVTDGFTNGVALLQPSGHPDIDKNTMPGSKIQLMKPALLVTGILLIDEYNVDFLGGFVESIVNQWKLTNQLEMSRAWGTEVTALGGEVPPPWRPVGQAVNVGNKKDLVTFKAMAAVKDARQGPSMNDDITEFEAIRKEAIADLIRQVKIDPKKSFAEGKQLANKDILSITEEGFTEEEARATLRRFKNNRAAALKFLIERRDGTRPERRKPLNSKSKYGDEDSEPEPEPDPTHQPSRDITLFGFIKPVITQDDEAENRKAFKQAMEEDFDYFLSHGNRDTERSGSYRERPSTRRSPREGGSGRRAGGRGGRSGGRGERGHSSNNETTATVQSEVYEPYRGRPTDFPAMGEREFLPRPSELSRTDTSRAQRQPNAQVPSRPIYRLQGVPTVNDYGAERADRQSRREYKPSDQMDRDRGNRNSGNSGRSSAPTTRGTHNSFTTGPSQRELNLSSVVPRISEPDRPIPAYIAPRYSGQGNDYYYNPASSDSQSRSPFSASTAYTHGPADQRPRSDPRADFSFQDAGATWNRPQTQPRQQLPTRRPTFDGMPSLASFIPECDIAVLPPRPGYPQLARPGYSPQQMPDLVGFRR